MTRGETTQNKVHYKGQGDEFLVFVDNVSTYKKWQVDKSIPLMYFLSSFKIFATHRQGAWGAYNAASQATLINEFGTHVNEDVIKQILEKGSIQQSEMPGRQGTKNDSRGTMVTH